MSARMLLVQRLGRGCAKPNAASGRKFYSTPSTNFKFSSAYDYVIVGAGSAGCVLANRLSADGKNSVLLLEAGGKDKWWNWKINMPSALQYNLCNDKHNWYYHTQPQKNLNNRVLYWPRGKVWGGSSALNAMVYIRGHAHDYDRWESEGADDWSYADCLPYFKKAQTHVLGEDDYRGGNGPLHVSRGTMKNPLFDAFIAAGQQAGYPYTADMNGYQQEGFGPMDMTTHKGKRWSTSMAYLKPALKRKNLKVESHAHAMKILMDGTTAKGVAYGQGSQVKHVQAKKEVILSGGAINSPQLLMLSGIGNSIDLSALGIKCNLHLPGVGRNLQDHLEVYVQHECLKPITLYSATRLWNMPAIGIEWFLFKTGLAATNHMESGGFVRSRSDLSHPDIQFHFLPYAVFDHGRTTADRHAYQVHVGTLRATSRGHMFLRSSNPFDAPVLQPNYLQTKEDVEDLRASVKITREIFAQKAFEPFRGPEMRPGSHVQSDKEIDAFVREKSDSAYHPSCTCKMGREDDAMAVVDSKGKIYGAQGLRVVDASVMPSVVSGNLNAPTIMLAEKMADAILGNPPLEKSKAPVYQTPTATKI